MESWTGFLVGFLGSFHCVGMCGPIVIALAGDQRHPIKVLFSRLLYNFGRVFTYSFLGLLVGVLGKSIKLAGYQQVTSIVIGILILIGVFFPNRVIIRWLQSTGMNTPFQKIKNTWFTLFRSRRGKSMFFIGILNGFLPCGFVYLALAGALSTGGITNGILYMALFGIGTTPIMLLTAYAGNLISLGFRRTIHRLIPAGAVLLAVLFILRGLSLGIPYVSPRIEKHSQNGVTTVEMDCCHDE